MMNKARATALIRELLLRELMLKLIEREIKASQSWASSMFETLHKRISEEMVTVRRQLHSNAIFIIEKEWRNWDVVVKFKEKGLIKEVPYMLPMLEAEAIGMLEHILDPQI
ncbi:hypothetical protein [Collibacillus ludicampi]|nr:hypothetical protein [Collibacillus ludicampi]